MRVKGSKLNMRLAAATTDSGPDAAATGGGGWDEAADPNTYPPAQPQANGFGAQY